MSDITPTEAGRTLGALLRLPYAALVDRVYGSLAGRGFPEIRVAHGAVLRHIRPAGSRLTELAERAGMAKQSMAYLVEDLAGLGFVATAPDPSDGRARLVRLTAKGRKLMATMLALSAEAEAEFIAKVGAADMRTLRRVLEKVVAALES
jgi:DNA-binding MarR family transcriptional regulator